MSVDFLRLIPTTPGHIPESTAIASARDVLASLVPEADDVTSETHDSIQFIDAGQNFESIACPFCRSVLGHSWWTQAMDTSYESGFTNLEVICPYCETVTSLNDLAYDFPVGFAKFSLEAKNANPTEEALSKLHEVERAMGCPLRVIRAHY